MPTPPARAGPASAATTGFGQSQIARMIAGSSGAGAGSVSLRSLPAQNTGPAWSSR